VLLGLVLLGLVLLGLVLLGLVLLGLVLLGSGRVWWLLRYSGHAPTLVGACPLVNVCCV